MGRAAGDAESAGRGRAAADAPHAAADAPHAAAGRAREVLERLEPLGGEEARAGMARYGIRTDDAFGVSIYELRRIAKELGRDHDLALALWVTGNHEARLLASMVDDPAHVTEPQMDEWTSAFDSWDVCDQVTSNLFDKTPFAWDKVEQWSGSADEWVKRAAFATAAALAVQDKRAADEPFLHVLDLCRQEAGDDRNYVKKAVNWALRNIGKRNPRLHTAALRTAEEILAEGDRRAAADRRDAAARAMRWVARDALRELRSEKVVARVHRR
jgi:3-methyladenine DNA glycosylase AlkD